MFEITVMNRPFRGADVEILDSVTTDETDMSKAKRQATKMLKPFCYEGKIAGTWGKNFNRNWVRHESEYGNAHFVEISEVEETPEVKPEPEFVNTVEGDTLKPETAPEVTVKKAETLDEAVINARAIKKTNPELAITAKVHGDWLWISGETFKVKNDFKDSGFFWARKKQMWYWKPSNYKRRRFKGAREFSIAEIVAEHGELEVDINATA